MSVQIHFFHSSQTLTALRKAHVAQQRKQQDRPVQPGRW